MEGRICPPVVTTFTRNSGPARTCAAASPATTTRAARRSTPDVFFFMAYLTSSASPRRQSYGVGYALLRLSATRFNGPSRSVQRQAERPGEEDGHLLARDRRTGTEQGGTAAAHHAAVGELLDPWAERAGLGHVGEQVRRHAGWWSQRRIERAQHE